MELNKDTNRFPDKRYCYVVEGKTDEDKLKKIGCEFVIKTGGKFIKQELISFLGEVKKKRDLILVLDPDGPGREIRDTLNKKIGESFYLEINKKDAISYKKSKVGVAEVELTKLKGIMRQFILHDISIDDNFSLDEENLIDYLYRGSKTKENKEKIIKTYAIPFKTFKNIYDALLMLDVSKNDLEELLNE